MPDVYVRIAGDAAGVRVIPDAATAGDVARYACEHAGVKDSPAVLQRGAVLADDAAVGADGLLLVVERQAAAQGTTAAPAAGPPARRVEESGLADGLQHALGSQGPLQDMAEVMRTLLPPHGDGAGAHAAPAVPPTHEGLRFLIDMMDGGASEGAARRALLLNRMDVEAAAEWLMEHLGDADLDDPVPPATLAALYPRRAHAAPTLQQLMQALAQ
eukprot:TRINITY_DN4115_c0_g1_i1.p2 TRINITY_DN4115_c0_g1~~TRINITY_DN4115_c0_g1_i1.p2  ORF type:complete len:215 (+),score=64.81 TRINITY_DN4115_c0_g1_i1:55-699(+)